MYLKSEGCASNLFDPMRAYTFKQYCAEEGLPYARLGDEYTAPRVSQHIASSGHHSRFGGPAPRTHLQDCEDF
jgi:hypothetical protein